MNANTENREFGSLGITPFSELIAGLQLNDSHQAIELPDDWLQGRTAYGGLTAALSLLSAQKMVEDLPPLRSAQFCFLGPAVGTLRLTPRVLRRGKSVVFIAVDVEGEMGLAARATLCFGVSRESYLHYLDLPKPVVPDPDSGRDFFTTPGQPAFMDHFEGRLVGGSQPRTAGASPEILVWLRHRDQKVENDVPSLLAMADALPPPGTVLFREPAPISTVTWSVEMMDSSVVSSSGWWLSESRAESVRNGFSTQQMSIWSPDGTPILIGRQCVATFEKQS